MLGISCRDNSFPALPHAAAVRVVADLGLAGVDISVSARHPHVRPEHLQTDLPGTADAVVWAVRDAGLQVADLFALPFGRTLDACPLNHPDEQVRNESRSHFRPLVDFALRIGSPGISLLPGIPFGDGVVRAAEELNWRAELARAEGLALSFEPHAESVVATPEACLELLSLAPGVDVTLDYSHFVAQGIPETDVDALLPRTRHVQARQAAPGTVQAPSRLGTIDFPRIVGELDAAGYGGWFGIEYITNPAYDNVDCLRETALLRDVVTNARRA